MLEGREIIVGVSGGIAAYKAAALTSLLVQQGAGVTAVLTRNARRFVGAATFAALTARPVATRSFDPSVLSARGAHRTGCPAPTWWSWRRPRPILSPRWRVGAADDLLTTLLLCAECPVVMAPAMNSAMWAKPSVQRNVRQVAADGVQIIQPGTGWLSCRQQGAGTDGRTGGDRGRDPRTSGKRPWETFLLICSPGGWRSMARILLTAGPTRAYIDEVRYLTNASSGRMARAIAQAALARGHQVTIVSGPVAVRYPARARVIPVVTTAEMLAAAIDELPRADGVIAAAAPCDFEPDRPVAGKIPRTAAGLSLKLQGHHRRDRHAGGPRQTPTGGPAAGNLVRRLRPRAGCRQGAGLRQGHGQAVRPDRGERPRRPRIDEKCRGCLRRPPRTRG